MNREGKKCLLYSRVSTEMQVDGYSLEAQKNCLKRFAEREEMIVVDTYEDAGKSGKSIEGRPAFKKMLSDIESGINVDYVLVYKLSRFGRNAADILNSLALLQTYDVNLICIEEGIDSSQTSGKLLISVLSAVAEIERENILEQTMNGRREKARQGLWNGGPAPYGYLLKDNRLYINEEEAELIRLIFDKYANTTIGYTGIAKYLNLQCIKKTVRDNMRKEDWNAHCVKMILENPVYCGRIAYGRRTLEKVKGKRDKQKRIYTDDYIIVDGVHDAIVSEELWDKVSEKRKETGKKFNSVYGNERIHLLTGLLKCPICGGPMYANRHCWTKKDGTYKEVGYYVCGRNKHDRGHFCDYKADLKKTVIEPLVIEAIKELVKKKHFANAIENRISNFSNDDRLDKEIKNFEDKLNELNLTKARLETEIDTLPYDVKYREKKLNDLNLRLEKMYDAIAEVEEYIVNARFEKKALEKEKTTLENIRRILLNFSELFDIMNEQEQKNLLMYFVKEINLNPHWENKSPLKSIEFNFPIYEDSEETVFVCEEKSSVETVILLSRKDVYERIKFDVNVEDLQGRASSTATYSEIKAYILEKYGLKVSSLYIAQIKDKCGFEKRDNYNIGEGKSKELICPPEKEAAIMDAFRHFGMLRD